MLRGSFSHLASMILSKLHKMWSKLAVQPISLSLSCFVSQFLIHWSAWWSVSKLFFILSQALSGSLWLTLAHSGSLLITLAQPYSLSGSLWRTLAHSGSLLISLWLTLALSDSLWLTLAVWLSQAFIFSQDPCWAGYVVAAKPQFMS